jgi:hypothetical protein
MYMRKYCDSENNCSKDLDEYTCYDRPLIQKVLFLEFSLQRDKQMDRCALHKHMNSLTDLVHSSSVTD